MLSLKDIHLSFQEWQVFSGLSCEVINGDFIVMEGANGSGKSTLFDLITGKVLPEKGDIYLEGSLITKMPEKKRSRFVRRMSQNTLAGCFPTLTVAENLALALINERCPTLQKALRSPFENKIKEILDAFELKALMQRPMGKLSGGQRQMVSFLMAASASPRLLLLDEPTAALDPSAAERFLSFALDYIAKENITTILITHDKKVAASVGNKHWKMEKGKILFL